MFFKWANPGLSVFIFVMDPIRFLSLYYVNDWASQLLCMANHKSFK